MAKYDYKCNACGATQEIEKPMGSDWVPVCCNEGTMERIWVAVPVKFNGTGFYSTGG